MAHRAKEMDRRSVSEILADARALQDRHGPGVLEVAARWLRDQFAARANGGSTMSHSRLVLH